MDRLSTQSLWSLMGLVIRNADKLGIHRDGTFLGLSPFETEDRRRLWWQLQHLGLALAVRCGLTPLTLMAKWDAKLPLTGLVSNAGLNVIHSHSSAQGQNPVTPESFQEEQDVNALLDFDFHDVDWSFWNSID